MPSDFARRLLDWYARSHRDLPWRRTSDPYAIWLSEVMLQQTRVAAVIPYYERFLARFADPAALAEASEEELLACWAGLGYYTRARNLQRAARQMTGGFPQTHAQIRALPGIGDYSAAAISSIAFGLPHAAVDGNVLRVLSRIQNESGDIGSPPVRKRLQGTADELLDRQSPGEFNQAMMELGATVCLPRAPKCLLCPVADLCEALKAGRQDELPVKLRKHDTVRLQRTVFLIEREQSLLMWQRPAGSRKLAGFWELPEPEHLMRQPVCTRHLGSFRHSITFHEYTFDVYLYQPRNEVRVPCKNVVNCVWIACNSLPNMAISTTARKAMALYSRTG